MEAIGACANIAGLAVIVGHLVRRIAEDFEGIKNAPVILKTIKGDLLSLSSLLAAIEPVSESILTDALGESIKLALSQALSRCGESCQSFEKYLDRFSKTSSQNNRISAWVRVRIGFLEISKIQAFVKDLESCKHTLGLALAATYLTMSKRDSEVAEVMQQRLIGIERKVTQASFKKIQSEQEDVHHKPTEQGAQSSLNSVAKALSVIMLNPDDSQEYLTTLTTSLQALKNPPRQITFPKSLEPTNASGSQKPIGQPASNCSSGTSNTRQPTETEKEVSVVTQEFGIIELNSSENFVVGSQGANGNMKQKFDGMRGSNNKCFVIGVAKETPKPAGSGDEESK